jgi:hypothetical protein
VVDRWYYSEVFESATVRQMPTPDYFTTTEFNRRYYKIKQIGGYTVYRRCKGG